MNSIAFLQNLAVVLGAAVVTLLLFKKMGQPPVLGYLAAGLLVGPHLPPTGWVTDLGSIEALAEIGIVFLLFALGVEFNLARLARLGLRPVIAALIEVGAMLWVGYQLGAWAGWSPLESILFGGIVSLASTAIVARTVIDATRRHADWGDLVSGILIAEDILAILMIAAFSSVAQIGNWQPSEALSLLMNFAILTTLILVAGLLVLPRVLKMVEGPGMVEVRTLVIVGTCFAVAFLTHELGFSSGLGAFLAGAVAAESGSSKRLHEATAPFKDVFGAVFFVAVGMLIDPAWIFENAAMVGQWTLIVIVARALANFTALSVIGEETPPTVQMTLARLPIGEFSFILAQAGERLGLTEKPLYPLAVAITLGTTLASSLSLPKTFQEPERLKKVLPGFMERLLGEYRFLIKRLSVPRRFEIALSLIRPSAVQIALNVLGISGFFLGARWAAARYGFEETFPGLAWTLVAFFSMPFLLALWRKLQAVMLILLEVLATKNADSTPPLERYRLLSRAILTATTVAVAGWYLSLSVALLPPWPWTLVPPAVALLAGLFLWRGMNRLYAGIQVNLRETLSKNDAKPEASASALSYLIDSGSPDKAIVAPFRIERSHWATGQSIRETRLRRKTGTMILQLRRDEKTTASPDPDLVLAEEDEVLLFGEPEQVKNAKSFLRTGK